MDMLEGDGEKVGLDLEINRSLETIVKERAVIP